MTNAFILADRAWHMARAALAAAFCALAIAPAAHAQLQCTISTTPSTIGFDAISFARDVPIGSAVSQVVTTTTSVNCPANPGSGASGFYLQILPQLNVSTSVPGVWDSGLAGIGVRAIDVSYDNRVLSQIGIGQWADFAPPVGASAFSGSYTFSYQLIKTAQAAAPGPLSIGQMFGLVSHNVPANVGSGRQGPVGVGNTTVSTRSCTVATPNVAVALPTVSPAAFRQAGDTAGETAFQIGLSCQTGFSVYVTLSDATTPGNRTDRLTLSGSSTAAGVQLQVVNPSGQAVFYGADSPVAGNTNQFLLGPSDSTTGIALRARYVSTGTVTPGSVSAVATFTMSYQ